MSRQQRSERREKSLAEQVIIIVVLGIFMAVFIRAISRGEERLLKNAFLKVRAEFTTQVAAIHGQWLLRKSSWVKVSQLSGPNQGDGKRQKYSWRVYVNKQGWPDSLQSPGYCYDIWQQVMAIPLEVMRHPVAVVELNHQQNDDRVCRYHLTQEEYFDYLPLTGKVIYASQ
jgi:hypothetical protein